MPSDSKKGVLLLSSGIDSPVAGNIMLKQGIDIIALHFHNLEEAEGAKENSSIETSKKLAKRLSELSGKEIPLLVIENFGNEKRIHENTNHRFQCLLCKRMMYRLAERVAKTEGCDFIITGENLGQVASQTLENIAVLNESITIPVLRPLLSYDKNETIKLAEEIGTYNLSAKAGKCPFVPSSPLTKADIKEVRFEESRLDIDNMAEASLKGIKRMQSLGGHPKKSKKEEADFYNYVAKRFGGYKTPHTHTTTYSEGNPEDVFLSELKKRAGKDKTAMDLGCADGRFTLSVSPLFGKIVAIDLAEQMLEAGKKARKEQKIENVHFELLDAEDTGYPSSSFDIVYSRRGPTPLEEIKRLLVKGGCFIGIIIGEQDCRRLKEAFRKGQGYGSWTESRKEKEAALLESMGFRILFAKGYLYTEHYPTLNDLETFLMGVPIFTDFSPEKDRHRLEEYANAHSTKEGIMLDRHRVVIVAEKM